MAKERKKISSRFKNRFDNQPNLPSNQEVTSKLSMVINVPLEQQPISPSKKKGRPSLGKNRVKFTTMIDPNKRDTLKHNAINKGISLADLLDQMIDQYIEENGF